MIDNHIITIEFEADNTEELNILFKNLHKKYPLACNAKYGVRINGWSRDELPSFSEETTKTVLKGLLELLSEVDDIAYNEKMSAYELSYWLKKQIKPIIAAEEILNNSNVRQTTESKNND